MGSIHHESFYIIYTGLGAAALQFGLSYWSLQMFPSGKINTQGILAQLGIAIILATGGAVQFQTTGHLWPFGATAAVSGLFIVYYCWLLIAGPKPKKHVVGKRD